MAAGSTRLKVKIGGAEVKEDEVFEITVDLEMDLPDMASVVLSNIKGNASAKLSIGESLEVSANGKPLFKGDIVGLEPVYDHHSGSRCTVRALNRLHRLARGRKTRTFLKQSNQDIAKKIAQEHGLSATCDSDPAFKLDHVFQHNQTDLEFLRQRAARIDYEISVEDTKLLFRKRQKDKDSGTKLVLGGKDSALQQFRPRLSTANQVSKVICRGWDPVKKKEIVGTASASAALGDKSGASVAQAQFGEVKTLETDLPIYTQEEADAAAKAILEQHQMSYVTGDALLNGTPELKAGVVVTVDVLDPRFDGKYYITGCRHRYVHSVAGLDGMANNRAGYRTLIKVRRDAHSSGAAASSQSAAGANQNAQPGQGNQSAGSGAGKQPGTNQSPSDGKARGAADGQQQQAGKDPAGSDKPAGQALTSDSTPADKAAGGTQQEAAAGDSNTKPATATGDDAKSGAAAGSDGNKPAVAGSDANKPSASGSDANKSAAPGSDGNKPAAAAGDANKPDAASKSGDPGATKDGTTKADSAKGDQSGAQGTSSSTSGTKTASTDDQKSASADGSASAQGSASASGQTSGKQQGTNAQANEQAGGAAAADGRAKEEAHADASAGKKPGGGYESAQNVEEKGHEDGAAAVGGGAGAQGQVGSAENNVKGSVEGSAAGSAAVSSDHSFKASNLVTVDKSGVHQNASLDASASVQGAAGAAGSVAGSAVGKVAGKEVGAAAGGFAGAAAADAAGKATANLHVQEQASIDTHGHVTEKDTHSESASADGSVKTSTDAHAGAGKQTATADAGGGATSTATGDKGNATSDSTSTSTAGGRTDTGHGSASSTTGTAVGTADTTPKGNAPKT